MNCNPSLSLANKVYVRVRSASTVEPLTVIECQDGNHTVPQPKASEQSLNYACLLSSPLFLKKYIAQ